MSRTHHTLEQHHSIAETFSMSRTPDAQLDEGLDLSLETLDQWETELDQFAAGIMQRLETLTGKEIDMRGLVPQSQVGRFESDAASDADDDSEAMQVLKTLQDLTQ